MHVEIKALGKEKIAVHFEYDANWVAAIKRLDQRRWNAAKKRWEVHLAHLDQIRSIFGLKDDQVPKQLAERYTKQWSRCKLIVELDTISGRLRGAGAPSDAIDAVTSFPMPGHRFSPKFKSGQWDGKRHLFDRRAGKFPAGLWRRVKRELDKAEIEYELAPSAESEAPEIEVDQCPTELRPYQATALKHALKDERGILQIATGGGKTLLAAHLISRLARPTYFFVHTRELLHQAAGVLGRELGVEIGILGDGHIDPRPVTVATLQTVARIFEVTVPRGKSEEGGEAGRREKSTRIADRREELSDHIESAGLVIFDECHHIPAETAYKISLRTKGARRRYGLSATPWRDDGHDLMLEAALGPKICEISSSVLIKRGFLVPPHIVMRRAEMRSQPAFRTPYADIYRAGIVENPSRNRAIAAQASQWAEKGLSVLILVTQIEHGKRLLELLPEARFAHGSLDMDTRRQYVADLERKLHPILVATTLADEGLDIPSLNAVILAGGGKSATKAYQRIGRALRPAPGKQTAQVLDFFDPAPYLAEHSEARLRLYRHEPAFEVQTEGFSG